MLSNKICKVLQKSQNLLVNRSPLLVNNVLSSNYKSQFLGSQYIFKRDYSTDDKEPGDDFNDILATIKRIDDKYKKPTDTDKNTAEVTDDKKVKGKRGRKPKSESTTSEIKETKPKKTEKKGKKDKDAESIISDLLNKDTVQTFNIGNENNPIAISISKKNIDSFLQSLEGVSQEHLVDAINKTIKEGKDKSNQNTPTNVSNESKGKSGSTVGSIFAAKSKTTEDILGNEDNLIPRAILAELDRYIIGQSNAKKAVAVALRNRWRRKRLEPSVKADIFPKNILMVGPTGVGKTEIARRIAKIVNAPFVKVEATKYTEVGFHGADVDTMIRDLVEVAISNIKTRIANSHKENIENEVEKEIVTALLGPTNKTTEEIVKLYREKQLENIEIEIDVSSADSKQVLTNEDDNPFFKALFNDKTNTIKKKRVTVADARVILEKVHKDKVVTGNAEITKLAIQQAEQNGIVFIDEIDKVCTPREALQHGSDASTDGVQRDLLPIIEGCNVNTKYGMVDTSKILFIASGAFHSCKPSDLISELQGRLPIRVELKPLEQNDFYRILTEPENNQIIQQQALLKTENIDLQFTNEAIEEIAKIAFEANSQDLNIGARRLHGIIEKIVEEISFNCDHHTGKTIVLDTEDIRVHLKDLLVKLDLTKYII